VAAVSTVSRAKIDYIDLEARLSQLLADARYVGLEDHATLDAILAWAAARAYERGGYSAVKRRLLKALEGALMEDVQRTPRK
jgi:hypothetical protein